MACQNHRFIEADYFDFLKSAELCLRSRHPRSARLRQKADRHRQCLPGLQGAQQATLRRCPPASLLLTCSCSYHVDERSFQNILFRAAWKRTKSPHPRRHRQAHDHPISIFHPESCYLKSFILYLRRVKRRNPLPVPYSPSGLL